MLFQHLFWQHSKNIGHCYNHFLIFWFLNHLQPFHCSFNFLWALLASKVKKKGKRKKNRRNLMFLFVKVNNKMKCEQAAPWPHSHSIIPSFCHTSVYFLTLGIFQNNHHSTKATESHKTSIYGFRWTWILPSRASGKVSAPRALFSVLWGFISQQISCIISTYLCA